MLLVFLLVDNQYHSEDSLARNMRWEQMYMPCYDLKKILSYIKYPIILYTAISAKVTVSVRTSCIHIHWHSLTTNTPVLVVKQIPVLD